jgi:HEAT repeat protein
LQTALHEESDKDVQMAELRAIAVMGDDAVDVLRGLLESPDPEIKSMAIRGLAGGNATGPWPWPWPEPRPNP